MSVRACLEAVLGSEPARVIDAVASCTLTVDEAMKLLRQAHAADVRRELDGAFASQGGLLHAVFLGLRRRQVDAADHADNATTALAAAALDEDSPALMAALGTFEPNARMALVDESPQGVDAFSRASIERTALFFHDGGAVRCAQYLVDHRHELTNARRVQFLARRSIERIVAEAELQLAKLFSLGAVEGFVAELRVAALREIVETGDLLTPPPDANGRPSFSLGLSLIGRPELVADAPPDARPYRVAQQLAAMARRSLAESSLEEAALPRSGRLLVANSLLAQLTAPWAHLRPRRTPGAVVLDLCGKS